MSRSKNTIQFSDISSAPIKVKYSATYASQSLEGAGITINRAWNHIMTVTGSVEEKALKYNMIKQLYYKNYISGSLLMSGSAYDSSEQSTAASGSGDADIRYFPTESNAQICFLYVPRFEFGEKISRNSFQLLPSNQVSAYNVIDDGNGNLIDAYNNYRKVGNIFYSQGVVVFTDPDYVCILQNPNFDFQIRAIFPSPSPTPSLSITPGLSPSFTPTVSPSPSSAPVSPTPSVSTTVTPSITPTLSPSATPSISITPSVTPSVTISKTPSISVTPNSSLSVTPSITPSRTPTVSSTPPITPTISVTPIIGYTLSQLGLDPCFLQSTGFPVANASNIYLPLGVTDIQPNIYLYQSYNVKWTTITAIADASGNIYTVNTSGQVASYSTSNC